jgi:hypothetical protein
MRGFVLVRLGLGGHRFRRRRHLDRRARCRGQVLASAPAFARPPPLSASIWLDVDLDAAWTSATSHRTVCRRLSKSHLVALPTHSHRQIAHHRAAGAVAELLRDQAGYHAAGSTRPARSRPADVPTLLNGPGGHRGQPGLRRCCARTHGWSQPSRVSASRYSRRRDRGRADVAAAGAIGGGRSRRWRNEGPPTSAAARRLTECPAAGAGPAKELASSRRDHGIIPVQLVGVFGKSSQPCSSRCPTAPHG